MVVELVSFEFSFVHQGLQMGLVFRHSVFEVGKLILQQFCQIESMLALFVLVVKSSMSDLKQITSMIFDCSLDLCSLLIAKCSFIFSLIKFIKKDLQNNEKYAEKFASI